ncbi:hypothetical protein ACIQUS_26175 [Pseudomonas sp. NPDC090755]|uniref:hypothetical protein n=1 Tax=Pseudomonas sp. NPDC090755 TaxID=3364481 RepID=UPI00383BF305
MDLQAKIEAGEPLMQQVVEAIRRYHIAKKASMPPEEIERLRVEVVSLMQAVQEYQFRVLGGPTHSLQ